MSEPNYKETLNLPKTRFPMKANLAQREPTLLQFWQQHNIYQTLQQQRQAAPLFILNDGPPYANGDIHIGHALNKILKDMVIKSKGLAGFRAPYIPGWDCHGLPIELQVEKKLGKPGIKVEPLKFRKACRAYAHKQVATQSKSFQRLGVFGDWDNPYLTMDPPFEADIIRTLGQVIAQGHLVQGARPVHWCVECGSALAEAEVEYQDKTSSAIDVAFKILDTKALAQIFGEAPAKDPSVVIWTTTPWTLPANQAVCVHADFEYALVQVADKYYVLAKELVESVQARLSWEAVSVIATCQGRALEHLKLAHPFLARQVPIILGEHVTLEAGTGCVHTAPAHGVDDYLVAKHYDLPMDNPVAANGCFVAGTPFVENVHVRRADAPIIELLRQNKVLVGEQSLRHSYPHCWRHKTPLIFRATQQWFISMEQADLRAQALQQIQQVQWIPEWGQARIEKMVTGRPDWCVSRQRFWGTPMPLFVHQADGRLHPETQAIIEAVAKKVEVDGIDAWFELDPAELEFDLADYQRVPDTLDVWFDSGAVYACVTAKRAALGQQADLYLEGSDQHRGWFQTSLLSAVATQGQAPYKQVLTHGFTVDAHGRKMSKSQGNVVAPESVIKNLGADVLRLWVAATDYRQELNVSDEILKRTSDAYRRIRNTARFLLANLNGFEPAQDCVAATDMLTLDRWIVDKTRQLQQMITQAYTEYQFHVVYQTVHNFCVNELGSFYLDVIKDRQYTCHTSGRPRRSAQTALYYVAEALVRWIAPILSFTAEEIWQCLPGERDQSVFLTTWWEGPPALEDTDWGESYWQAILAVRTEVNKALEAARQQGSIGSGLEAEVVLYASAEWADKLEQLGAELRFVLITSQATVSRAAPPADSVVTDLPGLALSVAGSKHPKCVRCWHRREDVGQHAKYPGICQRCVQNIATDTGEVRAYA